ncbi:host attachment family protein [Lutibaculum baratangense]|uniref:Host attachment protein n=1 Tax=Lutibaculum baratangense AMV1 TaxID=631454 RepID=V4TCY5_9HYPH|nr:host attachment family protein [Lutibaculum baratangense]ESR24168.1 hypothetical protein N177_2617 [Lutibaculum baratangense AMV1]
MTATKIPADALVFVGDGRKAIFLRNKGTADAPNLEVENVLEHENPSTREQSTDRPGRLYDAGPGHKSGVGYTDWHQIEEDRFAGEIAQALYKAAHKGRFDKLVVVAPPRTLGVLRKEYHKEVADRIVEEVNKDLTGHPVDKIEDVLLNH